MTTTSPRRASERQWWGLAVLGLPTLLLSLDFSVLYLALPSLAADLSPSGVQELWIMDIYGFMTAGFLVTMGTLGDRIGRRRLLLIGAAAFGVASIAAAFSPTAEMLIASRALMGVAGAMVLPSTLALISSLFKDPRQMAFAISMWMACFMGGLVVGPVIGGALLCTFWWGSVFLLGVPVMVLLLLLGPSLLPEDQEPESGKLDMTSVAMSLIAVLGTVYALKDLAREGWTATALLVLVVSLVVGAVFVRRQLGLESPLLNVRLFEDRVFSTTLVIWMLGGAGQGGVSFLVAQHLQSVLGLSTLRAGLALVPASAAMIAAILAAPALASRFGPARVMAGGLVVAAIGAMIMTQIGPDDLTTLLIGYSLGILGLGMPSGLVPTLVLRTAPAEKAGSASAIQETTGEFGMAAGVAALGSIATAVYGAVMRENAPHGTPAEAFSSLSGAVTAVEGLPSATANDLLYAAQSAYTDGLIAVCLVAAIAFAALAVLAVTQLRGVKMHDEEQLAIHDSSGSDGQTADDGRYEPRPGRS